jgi:flagellar protein FliO/FliZ
MPQPIVFFFAFVVVLALIGAAAWLVRRFAGNRLGANANRGRMPRLAVIDAAAVDGRRRLVLVRRDNVEHLLMIGGPTDIVVEPNIVRAMPARDQAPPRPNVGAELPPRVALPDASSWSDSDAAADHPEPAMPEPPPRPSRPSFADEVRRPTPAPSERRSDPLAGFTPEPMSRTDIREPASSRAAARSEPIIPRPSRPIEPPKPPPVRAPERAAAPPPPPSPALSSADQNLAEMAQRLEAALRRPAGDSAEPRVGAPPVAPEPPPSRPAPRPESAAPPVAPPAPKTGFENLEDEMASLLGRPKNLS